MSNNQKAVKYNPSDSKNVIQFALLRSFIESFNLFIIHYQPLNTVSSITRKAQSLMRYRFIHPSAGADGSLNKVLGIESFTQSLCLKAFPGNNSFSFFLRGRFSR